MAVGDVLHRQDLERRWEEHRKAEDKRPLLAGCSPPRPPRDSPAGGTSVLRCLLGVARVASPRPGASARSSAPRTMSNVPLAVVELWSLTPVALRAANTISPAVMVRIAAPE